LIQGWPNRVKEKGSVRRSVCERIINSPLRRCHQKSGSATPRALIVNSPKEKMMANTREVSKSRFTVPPDDIVAPNARDVMTKPKATKALLLFLAAMLSTHLVIACNALRFVYLGYPDFTMFYTGGITLRDHLGAQLYDEQPKNRFHQEFAGTA